MRFKISCLILNADASPISVLPLSVISWEDAVHYIVLNKATVLEWYEDWIVHSENWETRVPAVMILKDYQKKKQHVRFSKQKVFLRDLYTCQYCNIELTASDATLDHVLPVSHGGKTTFENCVCSCSQCNSNKGNNKKIVPKNKPVNPTYFQLADKRKKMQFALQHPSWALYLE